MTMPGMSQDYFKVRRRSGADADGNPIGTVAVVSEGLGTYGTPKNRDLERASQAGQHLDAVLAVEIAVDAIKPGDLVDVRGHTWVVQWVQDVRIHVRVGLAIH